MNCETFSELTPLGFSGRLHTALAKHSKSFSLIDCISVGVDRMQRNFEPVRRQVEAWQRCELTDVTAKVVMYEVFVEASSKPLSIWRAPYTARSRDSVHHQSVRSLRTQRPSRIDVGCMPGWT
jgi:hypothetical protein